MTHIHNFSSPNYNYNLAKPRAKHTSRNQKKYERSCVHHIWKCVATQCSEQNQFHSANQKTRDPTLN